MVLPSPAALGKEASMSFRIVGAIAIAILSSIATTAQEAVTVKSLLQQDFVVVGAYSSSAGAALFLQKKDQLFLCVAAETPTSTSVETRYCKPVR
jgi:hypothetical protein